VFGLRSLKGLYARTRRWPVRIRIAAVSATLTLVILIAFAAVVGRLVSHRLQSDFDGDLNEQARSVATQLADSINNHQSLPCSSLTPQLGSDALIRISTRGGTNPCPLEQHLTANFGPPAAGEIMRFGEFDVATAEVYYLGQLQGMPTTQTALYVQYARPHSTVGDTIGRLWLFLGAGVAVGTVLAGAAGLATANRAMRPIAALTAAARDIADTRDPSRRIPEPESDDEVAELARTFDQMLRELDAARGETEDAMKRQREFVADASHELRTPLTSILANLELLDDSLEDQADDDERAAVGSALRSSKRMNRLVGDLLLLARADAGRVGMQADCDLAQIASEAFEEVSPVADGHHLRRELTPTHIHGNADELHRMALNLLENAIRHTPAGTTILLAVGESGDRAQLVVSDDGPGLPEGLETQVFERFVRGHGPADLASRNGTGTGLGLSIVRAVAVAHGGTVAAENGSEGARFTVSLPLPMGLQDTPAKV
jgi:two-component system OmpR family sensor kinase